MLLSLYDKYVDPCWLLCYFVQVQQLPERPQEMAMTSNAFRVIKLSGPPL